MKTAKPQDHMQNTANQTKMTIYLMTNQINHSPDHGKEENHQTPKAATQKVTQKERTHGEQVIHLPGQKHGNKPWTR